MTWERWLADLILLVHFAFVLAVVFPVPLIVLGAWRRWRWVRHVWFRVGHLAAMGVVAAQALLGRLCPLTVWEHNLRLLAGDPGYDGSFVAYWVSRLLYVDVDLSVLAPIYVAFGLLILVLLWLVPPEREQATPAPTARVDQ